MSLQTLFSPRSIALIGASTTPGSVGYDLAQNLVAGNYSGRVFLVNPKADTLLGQKCYSAISEIPESVELALIAVPASIVPQVLREAGEKMVRAAVIISSGFKETGEAGTLLEDEIVSIAREFHIALLGPNCLGFITPRIFLNASFASAIPRVGNIAFFSQSGALMSALLDEAKEALGFSSFISLGNKAVLSELDLLNHFKNDADTDVLSFYTEGLTDAPSFIASGQMLARGKKGKPVIALKSGKTSEGAHASSSHTGSVAGESAAYTALFRQARILEAKSFAELLSLLEVASTNPLPKGKRLAIVTNAGGLGVLATDAAIQNGLLLAELTEKTREVLRSFLPAAASVNNPIDVLGDAKALRYEQALQAIGGDGGVDMLLIILTPQTMTEPKETAETIIALRKKFPTLPMVTVFAGKDLVLPGKSLLRKSGVATLNFPEDGAVALGKLALLGEWQKSGPPIPLQTFSDCAKDEVEQFLATLPQEQTELGALSAEKVLGHYGFPLIQSALATTSEESLAIANKIGRPVVLKIVSPDIIHKSDVGGVLLDVAPDEADQAWSYLVETVKKNAPEAKIEGVTVSEMAPTGGLELLLGLKKEPGLGTLVVLGLGGIYVETLRDISMRFVPLSETDVDEMIRELKSSPLLFGTRGQKGINLGKLKECIARLNQLAMDFPNIAELDLNPLLAFPEADHFRVLDARITLEK